jgi:hypothetical protein
MTMTKYEEQKIEASPSDLKLPCYLPLLSVMPEDTFGKL